MKLLHLSDLHIGKRVNEFSMIEDQKHILTKIINIIDEEKPQGVIIAGDIYDKSVPSAEAVQLFDDFLVRLSKRELKVFVISGNHDSPERIAFGSQLMEKSGVYMSPVYEGVIQPITMSDDEGRLHIYMLPFIKPAHVRRYYPEAEITSYTDAIKIVIENMDINIKERNVLITHQFVTGASRCDSEDISIGGSDNVEATIFTPFDYVALGHIHSPQNVVRETIRYCGTPLKYSFSEEKHEKSVTIIELGEKGNIALRYIPLIPKRDMRKIKGSYMEVTNKSFYEGTKIEDYLSITLTDEEDIPAVINKLRAIYPNIMKLDYDNKRTQSNNKIEGTEKIERKMPIELFSELFLKQNNQELSQEQYQFTSDLIEKIWEDKR